MRLTEKGRFDFLSYYYNREGYNYLFRVGKEGICFSDNRPDLNANYNECLQSCNHYTYLGFFNKILADEILGDRQIIDLREEPGLMDWTKVDVDTPVLVRDNEDEPWTHSYFAFYSGGQVWTFMSGSTSWSVEDPNLTYPWNFAKIADEEDDYE